MHIYIYICREREREKKHLREMSRGNESEKQHMFVHA